MSLVTMIQELFRFIKDNLWKILIGAIIVSLVVVGLRYQTGQLDSLEMEEAYQDLMVRYDNEPAEFQFVVTKEDGTLFNNSAIFDEYFSQPAIVALIEKETGIHFNGWKKSEEALGLFKTSTFRGGLAAHRNPSSDVITVRVLVGKNEQENLEIATAYQALLEQKEIPFINNHSISILNDAAIGEQLSSLQFPDLVTVKTLKGSAAISKRSLLIFAVAGLIMGAIITTVILFLMRLLKKKINYAFDYSWGMNDNHFIYKKDHPMQLSDLIRLPKKNNRIVLYQENTILPNNLQVDQSMNHLKSLQHSVEEIVILIESGKTDKEWYHEQHTLANLYHVPIKIIQIV